MIAPNEENRERTPGRRKKSRWEHWQVIALLLMAFDAAAVCTAWFSALLLRFDLVWSRIPANYLDVYRRSILLYAAVCIAVFWALRLYNSIWRFVSYAELLQMLAATVLTLTFQILETCLIFRAAMPLSYYIWGIFFQFALTMGIRISYRFIRMERSRLKNRAKQGDRILLIGAGVAGQTLLREINHQEWDALHGSLLRGFLAGFGPGAGRKSGGAADGGSDGTADGEPGAKTGRGTGEAGRGTGGGAEAPGPLGRVVCMIDDNPNKWNRYVDGIPVVGGRDAIAETVRKYNIQKILLAMPSASVSDRRAILNLCVETGCKVKQLPGMGQLAAGTVTVSDVRDISMEDLLGREPIQIDLDEVFRFLQCKTILVTGGGGSIGSELCRQIAGHQPKRLIIFDVYENNAYAVERELREKHPNLDLVVLIGSVRDSRKLFWLFDTYRPDVVYHAAAHKHVPLMEASPCEAIKNNTIGTYKTAYAAMVFGCSRFVLISTDKAVNPTSVMGASKRLCEMIIQCFDGKVKDGQADRLPLLFTHNQNRNGERGIPGGGDAHDVDDADEVHDAPSGHDAADAYDAPSAHDRLLRDEAAREEAVRQSRTEFVAVRFGNVLGSNGSVIPIFRKQIAKGGPVTVTHPDIIRYFMTIPEAVSLVLLAGTYAKGGEIFVLDLGSPVKIDTLARNLIRLSGFEPDVDIKIEYTGLRAGEKLYEEMLIKEEGLRKTQNDLIFIGEPIAFDEAQFLRQLRTLMDASYANVDGVTLRKLLKEAVPSYHYPAGSAGQKAES